MDLDETLRPITVTVASGDKNVRGRITSTDLSLTVADTANRDAESVAEAATRVARGLVDGYRKAGDALVERRSIDEEPSAPRHPGLVGFFDALKHVELDVTSPRGMVKATWHDDKPGIRVRPDSPLATAGVLSAELTAAMDALLAAHVRRTAELFDHHVNREGA